MSGGDCPITEVPVYLHCVMNGSTAVRWRRIVVETFYKAVSPRRYAFSASPRHLQAALKRAVGSVIPFCDLSIGTTWYLAWIAEASDQCKAASTT